MTDAERKEVLHLMEVVNQCYVKAIELYNRHRTDETTTTELYLHRAYSHLGDVSIILSHLHVDTYKRKEQVE